MASSYRYIYYEFMKVLASLFLFSCLVFPRAYSDIKVLFLFPFIVAAMLGFGLRIRLNVFWFYFFISIIGLVGVIQGVLNGNATQGIVDAFRLWVVWSFILFVFFNYFYKIKPFELLDSVVVWSGIFISLINLSYVVFAYLGVEVFSDSFRNNMELRVGFHSSYIQLTSHNVGMLFFIIPYLLSRIYLKKFNSKVGVLHVVALFLTVATAIIAGRRALWGVMVISLFLIVPLSSLTFSKSFVNVRYFIALFALSLALLPLLVMNIDHIGFLDHFVAAFSREDERSIQAEYLIKGFLESPFLGQGFGSYAGYTRSVSAPWNYELTYIQLIFNIGLVGVFLLSVVTVGFFYLGLMSCSKDRMNGSEKFSALFGVFGLAIGAYSNPYFGSFDFLLLLGLVPLVAQAESQNFRQRFMN